MADRVIVTGGRTYKDVIAVYDALDAAKPSLVVQGGANGADRLAREWAHVHKVECVTFAASWKDYGHAAGPIRNAAMIEAGADLVLAFPGGRGTADCIEKAITAGIPVRMHGARPVPPVTRTTEGE